MARDIILNIYNSGTINITDNQAIVSASKWPGKNICNKLLGRGKEPERLTGAHYELQPGDPEYLPSKGLSERG